MTRLKNEVVNGRNIKKEFFAMTVSPKENRHTVGPFFQLILIFFTVTIIYGSIERVLSQPSYTEPLSQPQVFTPRDMSLFKDVPNNISVGFFIRSFSKFDTLHGNFVLSGSVWFEFDPRKVSLEQIGNFNIEQSTILEKSQPYVMQAGEKMFVRYDIKVEFTSQLEYQAFPLDEHRIGFVLANRFLPAQNFFFESFNKNFMVKQANMERDPEWILTRNIVYTGYAQDIYDKTLSQRQITYPVVSFVLEFMRISSKTLAVSFLPLLFLFFISLLSFSLDPKQYAIQIITISMGTLSAMIAYRFVIDSISPRVSYFMLSDYLYLIFLFANFIIFLISFLIPKFTLMQRKVTLVFLHGAVSFLSALVIAMYA
ncbi:MAG: hypothetical protein UU47_C0032G0004 [candidate division TM6 bacterium GW2011_GWE2_41_16]|nr:MAG: hypothetical protein UU47_C0032G0004 [candidate division TM6 bacterium GW2011_GWE2_41_16]